LSREESNVLLGELQTYWRMLTDRPNLQKRQELDELVSRLNTALPGGRVVTED
jgi:hypothetical protein